MSVLNKISFYQNVKGEVPNQELARELAESENIEGIKEIALNLWNKEKKVQSDCIKVLYEIGYIKPELIAGYLDDYLELLKSKQNKLVWSGMIAISVVAKSKAKEIHENLELIKTTIERGSVITVDGGIKTLSIVASHNEDYRKEIFPYLIEHLENCRPKEIPMHSEFIFNSVTNENKQKYLDVLNNRKDILTKLQLKRALKLIERTEEI